VVNLPSGRPTMQLTGGALQRLQALTPAGFEARIDLTISDEGPMALAYVIISAVPTVQPGQASQPRVGSASSRRKPPPGRSQR
jgi:holo-[acyl-carrier protein] synthase